MLYAYVYPGHTDYVPGQVWDGLLTRFRDKVARPDEAAKFRGSLIDDKMFAIDVDEWGLDNLEQKYRAARRRIEVGNNGRRPAELPKAS
jgi:hypothetical protein